MNGPRLTMTKTDLAALLRVLIAKQENQHD